MKYELLEEQFSELFIAKLKDSIVESQYTDLEVDVGRLFHIIGVTLGYFEGKFDCTSGNPYLTDSTDDKYHLTFGIETPDYDMSVELIITVDNKIFRDFHYDLTRKITYKDE